MEKTSRLIGRLEEKKILSNLYKSENAEFLAIYGRRRVGKTFLIREFFKDKGIYFEITGSVNAGTEEQLRNFHTEYQALFDTEVMERPPKNWGEAFKRLKTSVLKIKKSSHKIDQ